MVDFYAGMKPPPLEMSRRFNAPAEALFRAWSTAANIKRWFCPEGITIPEAEVEFRSGGIFAVCMRLPNGTDTWSRGRFTEVAPYTRLGFEGTAFAGETKMFTAVTSITLVPEAGGTRMFVHQEYELFAPEALMAVGGALAGWSSTLDRLAQETARLAAPAAHGSFSLERIFPAPPAQVFHALTNLEAKSRWFSGPPGAVPRERSLDVRPGGREVAEMRWADGTISRFDAVYFDVIQDARLIYAYEMHIDGEKISVSLATVELRPDGDGTKLSIAEQGCFINGYEDNGSREHGTGYLLGRLGTALGEAPARLPARNPAPG